MKPITQERMEEALAYLSDTDELCAVYKADTERAEYRAKRTEDAIFKRTEGTVAMREAEARTNAEALAAWDNYFAVLLKYETIRNKRATEAIVIEAWRSVNSNRRQAA